MKTDDLAVLGKTPQGINVALSRISSQEAFEESDHEFLLRNIDGLNAPALLAWLYQKPPYPNLVVGALVTLARKYGIGFELLQIGGLPHELLELYAEQTRGVLQNGQWWHIVRNLRETCPMFSAAIQQHQYWRIAEWLFPHRKDENACRNALPPLIREADAKLRRRILEWAQQYGYLDALSRSDILPPQVSFPFEKRDVDEPSADAFFLTLARQWRARPDVRQWLVDQSLRAIERDVSWASVWRVLPRELQDEVALRSLETNNIAPWAVLTIVEMVERGEPDAWDRWLLPNLNKLSEMKVSSERLQFLSKLKFPPEYLQAIGIDPNEQRHIPEDKRWCVTEPADLHIWLFHHAPWPANADKAFEDRLWSMGREYHEFIRRGMFAHFVDQPLTRQRANRLLGWALAEPSFFDIEPDTILRLVEHADPLPAESLPEVEHFIWQKRTEEGFAAYRKLGGDAALEKLQAWAREPLQHEGHVMTALYRMRMLPDMFDENDLAPHIVTLVQRASFFELLRLREEIPKYISEDQVVAAAEKCAEDPNTYRWCHDEPPPFSEAFRAAIRKRVRVCHDMEWEGLMRWLEQHDESPEALLDHTLHQFEKNPTSSWAKGRLSAYFVNRTRWTDMGPRVLRILLQDSDEYAARKFLDHARERDGSQLNVLGMHEALAVVLLERIAEAVTTGDEKAALAALQALVVLHPPTRFSGRVRALRKLGMLSAEVAELVALNERLLRHNSTRDAKWSDGHEALILLREGLTR